VLDLHLHTWPHQPGTPTPSMGQLESYCDTAAARGISQIAITEHSYRFTRITDRVLPAWRRPTTGVVAEATDHVLAVEGGADLDAYVAALLAGQDAGLPLPWAAERLTSGQTQRVAARVPRSRNGRHR
jgi:hypothetical protein